MPMNPEWIVAICAGVTLLILWTTTVIGGAVWLMRQFKSLKDEIQNDLKDLKAEVLGDFEKKHESNEETVKALEALVIRHDLILEPEFNGSGRSHYISKQRPRQ